ncbi:Gfo/Idh/MocA family oxidoreductase [Mesorhizobium sp. LHD-90]|uniref:Gfo/Idh/MocA family protein n=1 Tax=Mesorhizobium sp. LHD-90 TaxID=3071414 RepID=UPI0027E0CC19|nr:Gfo/Idh/MocA family oxidoreductase [Mesorhizobium sp. LHD-90]MDQ6432990.1 Gfo/Idh/MocA family oxidoreductase [Mesorhizobium sp. LHD-90]
MQDQQTSQPSASARPFTWGVVGTGAIARQFADDLDHVAGARIGAVCSRSEAAANGFMAATGTPKAHAGLAALLADGSIDAVYLATPNSFHAEQALEALRAKKPVLVEKPLATSSGDAARIADLAGITRCFVMEAMWTRFLPAMQALRDMLSAGAIGEVTHVEGGLSYRKDEAGAGRFFDPALGGGSALDLGVYPLSLAIHLLGVPEKFSGRWWRAKSGVDMRCSFDLSFAGATAALSCGFDRDGENIFTVFGSKGAIRVEAPFLKAQALTVFEGRTAGLPLLGAKGPAGGPAAKILSRLPLPGRRTFRYRFPGGGLQFEAEAAMRSVLNGEAQSSVMPLRENIAVLEVIETVLGQPPERE